MIPAVVLAGGASIRMGQPKALLRVGGQPFVRRILNALRDAAVPDAVVVVRPGAADVVREVAAAGYGRAVENATPERGQLSSLIVGLDAIDRPDVAGILVTLVDVPLVLPSTITMLIARAGASQAPIVRAVHHGRHGHPVVCLRPVFDALRRADPAGGAKPVMRAYTVDEVEIDDAGVLRDVDTPEDYAALG